MPSTVIPSTPWYTLYLLTFVIQQNVLWLYVSVGDANTMEVFLQKCIWHFNKQQKQLHKVTSTDSLTTAPTSCWKNLWASFSAIPTSGSKIKVRQHFINHHPNTQQHINKQHFKKAAALNLFKKYIWSAEDRRISCVFFNCAGWN